ncbi:unnamed protein product [Phytophthora fragariaefolia]|uniref:RxLR effector protein n=1 Tax=Phytophthora fragariaefolia TaxID=1490495 RepID=A0A9W6UCN6_9STRA|nr:unnamed protein product [Phytophthora fragariaefolia]
MRASYALLIVSALLSACGAVSASTSGAKNHNVLQDNTKRLLRKHGRNWNDKYDAGAEERVLKRLKKFLSLKRASQEALSLEKASEKVLSLEKAPIPLQNFFALDDLNRMVASWNFRIDKYAQWYRQDFSIGRIRQALQQKDYPNFDDLILQYINLYKPAVDRAIDDGIVNVVRKGKVTFAQPLVN